MQTTSITVVSESSRITQLESVAEFIESQCPYLCIDMTTALEDKPGSYKDVVIPTVGPVLVQKTPLFEWPHGFSMALRSRVWATLRVILTVISFCCVLIIFALRSSTTEEERTWIFFTGASIQALLNGIEVSNYRARIIREVMKKFEFWYLVVVHTTTMVGMGYLYYAYDVAAWAIAVGLGSHIIIFPLTIFAIDGSFSSPRARSITMIMWMLVYACIGFGCGLVHYISTNTDVLNNFVDTRFDLFFLKLSPQASVVATSGTLCLHFSKYASMMWRGRMYVLVYFEIQTANQEIGVITKQLLSNAEGSQSPGEEVELGDEVLRDAGVNDESIMVLRRGGNAKEEDKSSGGHFRMIMRPEDGANNNRTTAGLARSGSFPSSKSGSSLNISSSLHDDGNNNGVVGGSFSLKRRSSVKFTINADQNNKKRFTNANLLERRAPKGRRQRNSCAMFLDRNPLRDLEEMNVAEVRSESGNYAVSPRRGYEGSSGRMASSVNSGSGTFGGLLSPASVLSVTSISTFDSGNSPVHLNPVMYPKDAVQNNPAP